MQIAVTGEVPMRLDLGSSLKLSEDQLFELCARNRDLRIERTAEGDLVVMSPTGGRTGRRNALIIAALTVWAEEEASGVAFDSSTGFRLPSGAIRSPDAAWIPRERFRDVSDEALERFLPVTPDFVVELRSPSDDLGRTLEKMTEWRDQGVRLGWLIDPVERRVHVFRPEEDRRVLERPAVLSGDPELPGFRLDLRSVWQPL